MLCKFISRREEHKNIKTDSPCFVLAKGNGEETGV